MELGFLSGSGSGRMRALTWRYLRGHSSAYGTAPGRASDRVLQGVSSAPGIPRGCWGEEIKLNCLKFGRKRGEKGRSGSAWCYRCEVKPQEGPAANRSAHCGMSGLSRFQMTAFSRNFSKQELVLLINVCKIPFVSSPGSVSRSAMRLFF